MSVEKMSVSFEPELGAAIREAAEAEGRTVSAWLADAARDRVRLLTLGDALKTWERRHGALIEAEVAEADAELERAARHRRGRAS